MASAVSSASASAISQDQFLQLLIAQLQNQDPLDPVKDTDFMAQLAQFSSLQNLQTLNANFSQMLKLQQLTQGSDLIGRKVEYLPTGETTPQTGTVNSVAVENTNIVLKIGTASVPLNQVKTILS